MLCPKSWQVKLQRAKHFFFFFFFFNVLNYWINTNTHNNLFVLGPVFCKIIEKTILELKKDLKIFICSTPYFIDEEHEAQKVEHTFFRHHRELMAKSDWNWMSSLLLPLSLLLRFENWYQRSPGRPNSTKSRALQS